METGLFLPTPYPPKAVLSFQIPLLFSTFISGYLLASDHVIYILCTPEIKCMWLSAFLMYVWSHLLSQPFIPASKESWRWQNTNLPRLLESITSFYRLGNWGFGWIWTFPGHRGISARMGQNPQFLVLRLKYHFTFGSNFHLSEPKKRPK